MTTPFFIRPAPEVFLRAVPSHIFIPLGHVLQYVVVTLTLRSRHPVTFRVSVATFVRVRSFGPYV